MGAGFCRETPRLQDTLRKPGTVVFKQGNFPSGPWGVAENNTSHRKGGRALSGWPVEAVPGVRTI